MKDDFLTDDLCILAVQQDGYSLQFVRTQTEEIRKLAIQQNHDVVSYVNLKFIDSVLFQLQT